MVEFIKMVAPDEEEIRAVVEALKHGPRPAAETIADIPDARKPSVFRGLV